MPFSFYDSQVPEEYRRTFPAKLERMIVEEARRRAQILKSLGYDRSYAKMRVRGNLHWEFELGRLPAAAKAAEQVVDEVYGRS
jgi:hypothetical protein